MAQNAGRKTNFAKDWLCKNCHANGASGLQPTFGSKAACNWCGTSKKECFLAASNGPAERQNAEVAKSILAGKARAGNQGKSAVPPEPTTRKRGADPHRNLIKLGWKIPRADDDAEDGVRARRVRVHQRGTHLSQEECSSVAA